MPHRNRLNPQPPAWGKALRSTTLRITAALALATGLTSAAGSASAATDYPTKPIRLVIPFAAGAGIDLAARTWSEKLSSILGQPILIENRGGAGGIPGMRAAAEAAPDGYTLLVASGGQMAANKYLFKSLPYDPLTSFTAIGQATNAAVFVVISGNSEIKTMADLLKVAKEKPGGVSYGSTGVGSTNHIACGFMGQRAGVELLHVPYKEANQLNVSAMRGDITVACNGYASIRSFVQAGQMRLLAVIAPERQAYAPDVPTVGEFGVPGPYIISWNSLFAPAGTPKEIVDKIAGALNQAMADPGIVQSLFKLGLSAAPSSPDKLAALVKSELQIQGDLFRELKIAPE